MRGQNHIVFICKVRQEFIAAFLRLYREHIHRSARNMTGIQMLLQRVQIRYETAGQIDENRILLHMGELVLTEETGIGLAAIDMQSDHIGLLEQLVQRGATVSIAHGKLLFDVVEHHTHAKRLGDDGKLGADIAVADDTERLASHLVGAGSGLIPHAMLHVMGVRGNAAHQADDIADDQFHHGAGVRIWSIEYGDAMLARIVKIDLIGTYAEASDRGERRTGIDDLAGHAGFGSDTQEVNAFQSVDEFVFVESAFEALDFEAVVT